MIQFFQQNWHTLLISAAIVASAIVVALIAHFILFWLLARFARREGAVGVDRSFIRRGRTPALFILPLLAVLAILPGLPLPPTLMSALEHITGLGLIASVAWLLILLIDVASDVLSERYRMDTADNLVARRIQTQFQMLRRILFVMIGIVTLAIMLMTFPTIKHIGVSLLASAGLATLVVGVAMQGTLSNLIAGVQIALTQPFRLEDAVVVEGEWGWIEEIGTMYVVVRIWDLRRLVLPLSYFLTHSFQNWTRTSAQLLANVLLFVDYKVPLEDLRAELRRICENTKLWKGEVCILQVTDATEKTMQVRALMDARNSGDAWDLRCLVRERLIAYLQQNHPESLPRYRGEFRSLELVSQSPEGSAPQGQASHTQAPQTKSAPPYREAS
jgi:small-conductance mechanosensitive channel